MSNRKTSIDLQQVVVGELHVYKRPLNSSSGSAVKHFADHKAAVVTTKNGDTYVIEIGVNEYDDINYTATYREGSARIALVKMQQLQQWHHIKSVTVTKSGVTLEDLLNACNGKYCLITHNCWNAVEGMIKCVDADNTDWSWQAKVGGVGLGVVVGAGALFGAVGLLATALDNRRVKREEE